MKTFSGALLVTLAVLVQGCAAADIRPDGFQRAPTEQEVTEGRALLTAMAEAHGLQAYRSKTALVATIDDDWTMAPLPVKFIKPLPGDKLRYEIRVQPGSKDAQLTFLDGENKGQVWGIENGAAFKEVGGQRTADGDLQTMNNSVGTIGFLLHIPFMLESVQTVYALPAEEVNGRSYERVFFSWGTGEVNDDDQFIAWVDAETKRLSYLKYTARAARKSLVATMTLADHQEVDGVVLPGALILADGIGGPAKIHAMTVVEGKAEDAEGAASGAASQPAGAGS